VATIFPIAMVVFLCGSNPATLAPRPSFENFPLQEIIAKEFNTFSMNPSVAKITVGYSDGGKYRGPFEAYYKLDGSGLGKLPAKLELNDFTKRMKWTIDERVRCMLSHAKLSKSL